MIGKLMHRADGEDSSKPSLGDKVSSWISILNTPSSTPSSSNLDINALLSSSKGSSSKGTGVAIALAIGVVVVVVVAVVVSQRNK